MRPEMIRCLLLVLGLIAASAMPARAQSCTVTPPATFNLGTIDVLANTIVDVQTTISISCTVTAGNQVRLCLNLGDPNGEAGGTRYMLNGTNRLLYEIYTDAARTQRFSSWRSGTGSGLEHVFTSPTATYTTTLPIYARVFAGQQTVPTANPALTYTENFARSNANIHQRSRYTSTGAICPTMTTGGGTWASAMAVRASVQFKCLVTGGTLNFGTVGSLASTIDASTTIGVTCSNTLPYTISLDNGLNGTSPTTRKMANGSDTVSYSLYRDSARTLVWGSTIGTNTLSGTGTATTTSIPVYGRVPAQTTPAPATYTDAVQITVTY